MINGKGLKMRNERRKGSQHPLSKLTEVDVQKIRKDWDSRPTLKTLSNQYGVSVGTLRDIIKRKTWQHI
jgi:hypothetical protein